MREGWTEEGKDGGRGERKVQGRKKIRKEGRMRRMRRMRRRNLAREKGHKKEGRTGLWVRDEVKVKKVEKELRKERKNDKWWKNRRTKIEKKLSKIENMNFWQHL